MRDGFHSPLRSAAVWWGVLALAATGGCELLVDRNAALVDAGPDAVAQSCVTNGCVECEPVTASGCPAVDGGGADTDTGPSGSCAGGADCDAVPGPRDPWPQRCNALLWQESFAKPLTDERWGRSYGDLHIHVKPCGLLEWTAPPYNTIWAWLTEEAASGLPSDALVELRLLPKPRGNWAVALAVNVVTTSSSVSGSVTQGRICTLEHDLAGKAGYFRLSGRVYHDAGYDYEYSEYTPLAGNLVLQSWIEGNKHFCRVVPEGGKPLQVEHEFDGGFPEQGTIRLTVVNQATNAPYVWLWMDWLRVFAR